MIPQTPLAALLLRCVLTYACCAILLSYTSGSALGLLLEMNRWSSEREKKEKGLAANRTEHTEDRWTTAEMDPGELLLEIVAATKEVGDVLDR